MTYRNILVRATNWLGDAVMSLPALQHLRSRFPDSRISILARPWVAALYQREPFCDELIPYAGSMAARLSIAVSLGRRHFDCAILLQNAFEAAAVACLARIPARIGYNRDARGLLLTQAIAVPRKDEIPKHQRFYYLELLKRAGIISDYDPTAPIKLCDSAMYTREGRLQLATLISAESAIGVCPGAAYGSAKRWLPERFADSAIAIARDANASVVVMGSQAEYEICEQVQTRIAASGVTSINLAGKTSLKEFIAIVAACRLMLTNDSGAMHIGAALGIPTVTVFGATDHEATGPTGPHARIVREPVECSPCLLRECPIDHRCMTRIDADRVTRTALEVIRD